MKDIIKTGCKLSLLLHFGVITKEEFNKYDLYEFEITKHLVKIFVTTEEWKILNLDELRQKVNELCLKEIESVTFANNIIDKKNINLEDNASVKLLLYYEYIWNKKYHDALNDPLYIYYYYDDSSLESFKRYKEKMKPYENIK